MPRPRLTIRRLMVAVAAFAVTFAAWRLVAISRDRRRAADLHATRAGHYASYRESLLRMAATARQSRGPASPADLDREADAADRHATYHVRMQGRYARLARYPWLPVAPDPPEPEPE